VEYELYFRKEKLTDVTTSRRENKYGDQ